MAPRTTPREGGPPLNSKQRARLRERIFDLGAADLASLLPDLATPLYLCPLCAKWGLPRTELGRGLTLEDVPARVAGGRPLVLTCKPCNNTAGAVLEGQLAIEQAATDFARRKPGRPLRGSVQAPGTTEAVNIELRWRGDTLLLTGLEGESPAEKQLTEALERSGGSADWSLQISYRIGNIRRASVARLKAAYLAAFARFGYPYILGKGLKIVRDQIAAPDELIIPRFESKLKVPIPGSGGLRLFCMKSPFDVVLVQLQNRMVSLPTPRETNFYEGLEARSSGLQTWTGTEYSWPKPPPEIRG